jgi:nucleoid-associated protein YgaU
VSHSRVVRRCDTLPLLTAEVYGTSVHYLRVARANGLSHFRDLVPGQTLLFPPLAQ